MIRPASTLYRWRRNAKRSSSSLPVPLSSVKHDLQTRGYRGAALLAERMKHPDRPIPEPQRIEPTGVVTRKSSDIRSAFMLISSIHLV